MWELVLPLVAGLISTIFTNQSNKDLQKSQQDYNTLMLDKQNEYNSPANQMKRLEDAGVNPASVIMGNGNIVGSNQSASPLPLSLIPSLDPFGSSSSAFSQLMAGRLSGAQQKTEDTLRSVRYENTVALTAEYKATAEKLGLDSYYQSIVNSFCADMQEAALLNSWKDLDIKANQAAYLSSQRNYLDKTLSEKFPLEIQALIDKHDIDVLDQSRVVALLGSMALADEKTRHEISNIDADTMQKGYQTQNIYADTVLKGEQAQTEELKHDELELNQQQIINSIRLYLDTYDDVVGKIAADRKIAEKDAKMYYLKMILGSAKDVVSGAATGIGAAATLGRMAVPVVP